MNCANCGAMGTWMLVGIIAFAILVLVVIGLVVYWAMRLAMRHERQPKIPSEPERPHPPQRIL